MKSVAITRRSFFRKMTVGATAAALVPWQRALSEESAVTGPLRNAMDRSAKCCLAWLNPEHQFLPTGGYEVAHDTGRWWDAMLRYEAATGVAIPGPAEAAMMNNLRTLTDNSAALLTASLCNPHNLRETLLAYTELVRHRKSDWARSQGHKLVTRLLGLLQPDGQLDYDTLAGLTGKPLTKDLLMMQRSPAGQWFNATGSTGRAIEAIVWFYEATGDGAAMELARLLAVAHLRNVIDPSGRVRAELLDPEHVGHTHSYCGTLRGLVLYGLASGERKYVDAVANTYRKGIWGTSISHSGWTPHDQGKLRFPNKEGEPIGEHGSCSDVIQLALWLGLRARQTDMLDDVERLIRARVLPSQIVDKANPRRDGAWGVYSDPFGYGAILDVFAAVLHSLADVYGNVVTTAPDGTTSVHLHFDTDMPSVTVRAKRDEIAAIQITPKKVGMLRVRVPAWASRKSVTLSVAGKSMPLRWDGSYLVIKKGRIKAGATLTLQHDLPATQTVEEMPVSHRKFQLSWRGDEVIACDPKVAIYPAKKSG